ncbi:MAG: hypothetical protein M3O09_09835 [Acidobacteriota bacterium]|nr:hypothetical protein [Acidobacteriota bacterium]
MKTISPETDYRGSILKVSLYANSLRWLDDARVPESSTALGAILMAREAL